VNGCGKLLYVAITKKQDISVRSN